MSSITTILITRNEQENLPRCLESVCWSDEIVVVDSGSNDKTPEIARDFGVKFFPEDWKGYTAQKNSALDKASSEWVLSMDADEELTPEAQAKIRALVRENGRDFDGYFFRRKVLYLGEWITHGDWYPDYVLRLWRKKAGRFGGGNVHESVRVEGKTAKLREEILHYTYKDTADQMRRMERYARIWAQDGLKDGRTSTPADRLLRPIWRFLRGYIFRCGFLDGWRGALIAYLCAKETAMKYRYLAELQGRQSQIANRKSQME